MKRVEIKKVAFEMDSEDWVRLGSLMRDFTNACNERCETCPMEKFCIEHEAPDQYLSALYEFLDN